LIEGEATPLVKSCSYLFLEPTRIEGAGLLKETKLAFIILSLQFDGYLRLKWSEWNRQALISGTLVEAQVRRAEFMY